MSFLTRTCRSSAPRSLIFLALVLVVAGTGAADQWLALSPSPRSGHMAVLDHVGGQLVLVGGWNESGYLNDVWALRRGGGYPHWVPLAPAGGPPPGRQFHTLIVDPVDHALIMFGGHNGGVMSDLWKLSLTPGAVTWTQLFPGSPSPVARMNAPGVYDPVNHRMVIFGGNTAGGEVNDTWALDLTDYTWTELSPGGDPPSQRRHCMGTYDPIEHRWVVFGGLTLWDEMVNDTYALSLESGAETWTQLFPSGPTPGPRTGHAATYDYVGHRMLIYGGWEYPPFHYYNDVQALDLTTLTWTQLSAPGPQPCPRRDVSAVYAAEQGLKGLVTFGGNVHGYTWYGDTCILLLD